MSIIFIYLFCSKQKISYAKPMCIPHKTKESTSQGQFRRERSGGFQEWSAIKGDAAFSLSSQHLDELRNALSRGSRFGLVVRQALD